MTVDLRVALPVAALEEGTCANEDSNKDSDRTDSTNDGANDDANVGRR